MGGSSDEKLREELKALLALMTQDQLAAFYSDSNVRKIALKLYERWEKAGLKGEPLDYAMRSELQALLSIAKRVSRLPAWEAHKRWLSGLT